MHTLAVLTAMVLLGHIWDENSGLRYGLLRLYAWQEVRLLLLLFRLNRAGLFRHGWIRKPFYYLFIHLLASRGVICQAATLDEAEAFIDALPAGNVIAVGPCRCRVGNRNCGHAILTDIVIKRTASIWYRDLFPRDYRVITKDEAKDICRQSRAAGMIQCIDRHMNVRDADNPFVICNCCKESCLPLIGYRVFKDEGLRFRPGASVVSIDPVRCRACGACLEVCPFEERALTSGAGVVSVRNCQGCGLCVDACPHGASRMVPRLLP